MDNEYKSRQIAALMGGTPEDYQRAKNYAHKKPVVEETTIIQGEILSDEEKELIDKYRKNQKILKEIEKQKEKDIISDKNMIGNLYVIQEKNKRKLLNLNHILCIFGVTYCDGRKMYKVCFENSENVEVDYADALKIVKITDKHLTCYNHSRNLFAINVSKVVQIYEVDDDEYRVEMSGLKYNRHRADDNIKTFVNVSKSIAESIIEKLQNN